MTQLTATSADLTTDAQSWASHADKLALWTMRHLVHRLDQWVMFPPLYRRVGENTAVIVRGEITPDVLNKHYADLDHCRVAGLHCTDGSNTCKWAVIETSTYPPAAPGTVRSPEPPATPQSRPQPRHAWRAALEMARSALARGLRPVLIDSDGGGTYQLWIVLDRPAPTPSVVQAIEGIIDGAGQGPPPVSITSYPCQASCSGSDWNTWVRLPGHHHVQRHWSKIYNGRQWLTGTDAIEYLLAAPINNADTLANPVDLTGTVQFHEDTAGLDYDLEAALRPEPLLIHHVAEGASSRVTDDEGCPADSSMDDQQEGHAPDVSSEDRDNPTTSDTGIQAETETVNPSPATSTDLAGSEPVPFAATEADPPATCAADPPGPTARDQDPSPSPPTVAVIAPAPQPTTDEPPVPAVADTTIRSGIARERSLADASDLGADLIGIGDGFRRRRPLVIAGHGPGEPSRTSELFGGGLLPGEAVLITGSTDAAQTAFATQLADSIASTNQGQTPSGRPPVPVLYVSIRDSGNALGLTSVARMSGVSAGEVYTGRYLHNPHQRQAVQDAQAVHRHAIAPYLAAGNRRLLIGSEDRVDQLGAWIQNLKQLHEAQNAVLIVDGIETISLQTTRPGSCAADDIVRLCAMAESERVCLVLVRGANPQSPGAPEHEQDGTLRDVDAAVRALAATHLELHHGDHPNQIAGLSDLYVPAHEPPLLRINAGDTHRLSPTQVLLSQRIKDATMMVGHHAPIGPAGNLGTTIEAGAPGGPTATTGFALAVCRRNRYSTHQSPLIFAYDSGTCFYYELA